MVYNFTRWVIMGLSLKVVEKQKKIEKTKNKKAVLHIKTKVTIEKYYIHILVNQEENHLKIVQEEIQTRHKIVHRKIVHRKIVQEEEVRDKLESIPFNTG